MPNHAPLTPEAAAALARGDVMLAVKLVREATGLGLKEAHDAVRAHAMGRAAGTMQAAAAPAKPAPGGFVFPEAAAAAVARGDFIGAIAQLREANPSLDLKSAKDAVDGLRRHRSSAANAVAHHAMPTRPRVPTVVHGDSGRHGWLLLVVVAVVAAFAWWWMGNA
ncbi:MAG TPA: hypothetical protein VM619_07595 [Luteimonas sp.]|nr:hypothetical protein [Luteimonas sp.]